MKRKIKIHKEGHKILLVSGIILLLLNLTLAFVFKNIVVYYIAAGVSGVIILAFASFFRIPYRTFNSSDNQIIAPADGRVVVIEEVVVVVIVVVIVVVVVVVVAVAYYL